MIRPGSPEDISGYVVNLQNFSTHDISPFGNVDVIFAVLIGGAGNLYGALIGGTVFMLIKNFLPVLIPELAKMLNMKLPQWEMWLGIVLLVFLWSAQLFFTVHRVPKDAMQVNVVVKRWMWKLQHMTGQREINELHVPVGEPVKLVLTSEDVIHSFFVPAFRIKKDAIPGRYTTISFTPTKARYHLFCTEYCGAKHSEMGGWITVMEPADFQAWLAGEAGQPSPASAGEKLFASLGCGSCHRKDSQGRGPVLDGLFGKSVAGVVGT